MAELLPGHGKERAHKEALLQFFVESAQRIQLAGAAPALARTTRASGGGGPWSRHSLTAAGATGGTRRAGLDSKLLPPSFVQPVRSVRGAAPETAAQKIVMRANAE
jgi:hypothetical protein